MKTSELNAQYQLESDIEKSLDHLNIKLGQMDISQQHKLYELMTEVQNIFSMNNSLYQAYSPQYQFYICQALLMEMKLELSLIDSLQTIHLLTKTQIKTYIENLVALFQKAVEEIKK